MYIYIKLLALSESLSSTLSSLSMVNRNLLPNEVQLTPTPSTMEQSSTTLPPPHCIISQSNTSTIIPSSISLGDGNVLKKVASYTVERTNFDNTVTSTTIIPSLPPLTIPSGTLTTAVTAAVAAKVLRPSYVPEKLNFGAYDKFEGKLKKNNL